MKQKSRYMIEKFEKQELILCKDQQRLVVVVAQSVSRVRLLTPHGLQPSSLLCPWDSPGNNTGVGCHFPQKKRMKIKNEKNKIKNIINKKARLSQQNECRNIMKRVLTSRAGHSGRINALEESTVNVIIVWKSDVFSFWMF